MRVISGTARGLKLYSLEGINTRPTLDRVKESIFNMLFDECTDACVLDLFAGSGAMGIEALSRYAKKCTFVDCNKDAVDIIKKNIKKASFEEKSEIFLKDYKSFLSVCNQKYDLIFLDPPYAEGFTEDVLESIGHIMNKGCIIIVESDKNCKPHISDKYKTIKEKNYGRVNVCLLEAT